MQNKSFKRTQLSFYTTGAIQTASIPTFKPLNAYKVHHNTRTHHPPYTTETPTSLTTSASSQSHSPPQMSSTPAKPPPRNCILREITNLPVIHPIEHTIMRAKENIKSIRY